MAIIISKKFKDDLGSSKIIGFDFPLNGNAVFNPTYQTRDQIKANLINYLLTNKKERVFNPNFGANLRSLLFENIDDNSTEDLRSDIEANINLRFPTIKVHRIKFNVIPDENSINFELVYEIKNFGVDDKINILIQ